MKIPNGAGWKFVDVIFDETDSPATVIHMAADELLGKLMQGDGIGDILIHAHEQIKGSYGETEGENAFSLTLAQVFMELAGSAISGEIYGFPG